MPVIQNEMITTVGAIIVNNSQEIRDSKYFSIMSDEEADISNKENLSVVIRFLDSTKTVREEFVGFYLTSVSRILVSYVPSGLYYKVILKVMENSTDT